MYQKQQRDDNTCRTQAAVAVADFGTLRELKISGHEKQDKAGRMSSRRCGFKRRCNKCLAAAKMGDRLATTDISRKLCPPRFFGGGELSPHLTQCRLGRGLYLRTK